ncbi:MAG: hypothetical protein ACFFD9_06010 [Candidatus Thorarchaeota archaeon]
MLVVLLRVKALRARVRVGIFVVVCGALFILAASQLAVGNADYQSDCATCHGSPSTIVINTATTIDTEPGATFPLNVQVDATGGPSTLVVKFPTGVSDNNDFTYVGLDASGFVRDDDVGVDLDTDPLQIEVDYSIVAPVIAGTYTLKLYAVGAGGNIGTSTTITVNVIQVGPGPSITDVNGTPGIPTEEESVIVTANVTSGVAITEVTLQYSTDNSTWNNVTMTLVGQLYQGSISAQPDDTYVTYRIVALDTDGIWSVTGVLAYRVGDFPEPPPPPPPQWHFGWYLGLPALLLAYLGTALEYYDEEKFTRAHGIMLSLAYILTSINVIALITASPSAWTALNPAYLFQFDLLRLGIFIHSWHIWLGIISMILGSLAFITHLAGWKTCNLGLPAVILWTILGFTGMYLNVVGFGM